MHLFTSIVARPHFYHEAVADWNVANPQSPHVPLTGSIVELRQLEIDDSQARNLTVREVTAVLIANRVPVEWIDHAYTFGVAYLNYHYFPQNAHAEFFDSVDDECLRRLRHFGVPPAISNWDGWYVPTPDDLIRLSILLDLEDKKGQSSVRMDWYLIGALPMVDYLGNRPHEAMALRDEPRLTYPAVLGGAGLTATPPLLITWAVQGVATELVGPSGSGSSGGAALMDNSVNDVPMAAADEGQLPQATSPEGGDAGKEDGEL
ncbi:hypothetical protein Hypma_013741 [Hypsizygus marmoreus]|uniref:Uncharacterized protein n=1 Tax=Hypsizygus marmoreus TaxID=39966 RepID=A0A369JFN3_HYPMA|nr:hypothetical protein Hypma_013741 [Hypsizygus marmoreus]